MPVHVRQSAIDSILSDSQPLVVDAEQVQHGRVHVVDLDGVLEGLIGPFVGRAVAGGIRGSKGLRTAR